MKYFKPIVISSSFFTCSMPLNLDTYRYCPFQCEYCFMKNRVIGKRIEDIPPNIKWLKYKFKKVYDKKDVKKSDFIETLLKNKIDLHCGTKSEAFQPAEKTKQYTKQIVDICNEYDQHIVFTTKSDSYYDVDVDPSMHSFQFSVTNHYSDKFLEPNVPSIEKRLEFYKQLKDEGFKVGLRIEPFIPNITDVPKIVELFDDIDYVHISQLMMLPQITHDELLKHIQCPRSDFITHGVTIMKPEILYRFLEQVFDFLEDHNYNWNSRFMNVGNQECCCGDELVRNSTKFDTLHLKNKYGDDWSINDGLRELGEYKDCKCDYVWTSNRRHGCVTVEDFYKFKWDSSRCTFNPKNQFKPQNNTLM